MLRLRQTLLLLAAGLMASCMKPPVGSTDSDATASSSSGLAPGQCESEFHGTYWCECENGHKKACDGDGVSVCFIWNDEVITEYKWGPCGECEPGMERPCEVDGASGKEFCNVADDMVDSISDLPTPRWGICVVEEQIACLPGQTKMCDDVSSVLCGVDEMGVPYWLPC